MIAVNSSKAILVEHGKVLVVSSHQTRRQALLLILLINLNSRQIQIPLLQLIKHSVNTEIKTGKVTLFANALTGISTADEADSQRLPTSQAVNTAITSLKTTLTSDCNKADTSTITTALINKANTPSAPTATGHYLRWTGCICRRGNSSIIYCTYNIFG